MRTPVPGSGGPDWAPCFLSALTRIAPLAEPPLSWHPLRRTTWTSGDYVVAEVTGVVGGRQRELRDGRMVGDDGRLHPLTAGGLLKRMPSLSTLATEPAALRDAGHVLAGGRRTSMDRHVTRPSLSGDFTAPVVLPMGTSMWAGKTTAARVVIPRLRNADPRRRERRGELDRLLLGALERRGPGEP